MHEALGAATPRILGHLRIGSILPALWFWTAIALTAAAARPDALVSDLPEGIAGLTAVVAVLSKLESGHWIVLAIATLTLAHALDLSNQFFIRMASGNVAMSGRSSDAQRVNKEETEDSIAGASARHDVEASKVQRWKATQATRVRRRRVDAYPIDDAQVRTSLFGNCIAAAAVGPMGFDYSKLGPMLEIVAEERGGNDAVVAFRHRTNTFLVTAFCTAALTPIVAWIAIPLGLQAVILPAALAAFSWFAYRQAAFALLNAKRSLDYSFFVHRVALAAALGTESFPKDVAAETEFWAEQIERFDTLNANPKKHADSCTTSESQSPVPDLPAPAQPRRPVRQ